MNLSSQQCKNLRNALIDAFPDKASLERMLWFQLEKSLDVIAGGNNLQEIVFNLIKKSKAENWTDSLIFAARKSNSGNLSLKAKHDLGPDIFHFSYLEDYFLNNYLTIDNQLSSIFLAYQVLLISQGSIKSQYYHHFL